VNSSDGQSLLKRLEVFGRNRERSPLKTPANSLHPAQVFMVF